MTDDRPWQPSPARYEDALASLGVAMLELCELLERGEKVPEQLLLEAKKKAGQARAGVTRELIYFLDATALYLGIDEADADRRYFYLAVELALEKFGGRRSRRAATGEVKPPRKRAGRGDSFPSVLAFLFSTHAPQVEEQLSNRGLKPTQKVVAKELMELGKNAGLRKVEVDGRRRKKQAFSWAGKTVTKQLRDWPAVYENMNPAQRAELARDLELILRRAGVDLNSEISDQDYLDPSA
jgi:hypothetical protein